MTSNNSGRHHLPYLVVSQAQKELTHNEALCRIDALLHPAVEGSLSAPPSPAVDDTGKCWLVGGAATGMWQGKSGQVACWIGGGWRFLQPVDGMRLRDKSTATDSAWIGGEWIFAPSISNPAAGGVIDIEARAAIAALLSHFRTIGLVAD